MNERTLIYGNKNGGGGGDEMVLEEKYNDRAETSFVGFVVLFQIKKY